MTTTRIAVRSVADSSPACPQLSGSVEPARLDLVVGKLAPRLVSRGTHTAHIAVTAAEMLLLDGDQVSLEVFVGPGCTLHIEDVGGTVAYPRRDAARDAHFATDWRVDVHLAAGAALLWKSLPFVLAQSARVSRRTVVQMEEGARLLLRETLVLGRHGEAGGRIRSSMEISSAGRPLLAEETSLDGEAPEPGILGGERILDSLIAAGFRPETVTGELVLEEPGAVARFLGRTAHESPLDTVWHRWEPSLHRTAT